MTLVPRTTAINMVPVFVQLQFIDKVVISKTVQRPVKQTDSILEVRQTVDRNFLMLKIKAGNVCKWPVKQSV